MNTPTANEHAAAIQLADHAEHLAAASMRDDDHVDLATARITYLASALELEMRKQKENQRLIFISNDCLKAIYNFVTFGEDVEAQERLVGLLESIDYEPPKKGENE